MTTLNINNKCKCGKELKIEHLRMPNKDFRPATSSWFHCPGCHREYKEGIFLTVGRELKEKDINDIFIGFLGRG
jgi:hypothetical protein